MIYSNCFSRIDLWVFNCCTSTRNIAIWVQTYACPSVFGAIWNMLKMYILRIVQLFLNFY